MCEPSYIWSCGCVQNQHQILIYVENNSKRQDVPQKFMKRQGEKLVIEAAERQTALREQQEFLTSTGSFLHVTTISRILHLSGLWGRVERQKPFLTKKVHPTQAVALIEQM